MSWWWWWWWPLVKLPALRYHRYNSYSVACSTLYFDFQHYGLRSVFRWFVLALSLPVLALNLYREGGAAALNLTGGRFLSLLCTILPRTPSNRQQMYPKRNSRSARIQSGYLQRTNKTIYPLNNWGSIQNNNGRTDYEKVFWTRNGFLGKRYSEKCSNIDLKCEDKTPMIAALCLSVFYTRFVVIRVQVRTNLYSTQDENNFFSVPGCGRGGKPLPDTLHLPVDGTV